MKLYELPDAFKQIEVLIASQEDGELSPEIEARLDALQCTLQQKVDGCCAYIRNWLADSDAAMTEAERLNKLGQVRKNRADRLKRYLLETLERLGMQKVETDIFVARIQKSPPSIVFHGDPSELPDSLARTTITPDNAAAMKRYKDTGELPEGWEVKQGHHLRIS